MDVIVNNAIPSMIDDIVKLDESVIGSRNRECIIRHAVESGQCYIINTGHNMAAYGIMDYNFYEKGFISLLIVGQEYRRKGIGKLLVKTFIDLCSTDKLFTSTNSSNLPMQKLLENCKFKRCGMIDELDEGDPEIVYCYNKKSAASYSNNEDAENKESNGCNIIPMDRKHLCDLNKPNQSFSVFGRLIPTFANGEWTWTEELLETPYEKQYPDDELDYSEYIGNPDKTIFMAYMDNQCAGQIRLRRNWNKYCYIEDIAVGREYQGMGLGRKLINAAIQWAKEGGMPGLMLETQDINLAACRFYQKCGFVLGAVDTMLYENCPNRDEKALFWYMVVFDCMSSGIPHKHAINRVLAKKIEKLGE